MFQIVSQAIDTYIAENATLEPPLLQRINRETHLHVLMPRMVSGHPQGLLLSIFSNMLKPKQVLEIGTYTGYATLCLASGLQEGGRLITIDVNEELEERCRGYFAAAGLEHCIDYRIGNAIDIVPILQGPFDLVFIDADKKNYLQYYEMVIGKMNKGGLIIADNVLWSGKIVDELAQDKDTEALRAFNDHLAADERVRNLILPFRDGLLLAEVVA